MSPIKHPENYPPKAEWRKIRESILIRATPEDGFDTPRCECEGECGNHKGSRCYARHGWKIYRSFNPVKLVKVVLTLAHLDHDASTGNHDESNLKALCQRCHLRYDGNHRRQSYEPQEALF